MFSYGNADRKSYEAGRAELIAGVRNVGNQSLYRRGQVWVSSEAAHLELPRDAAKITDIQRFSQEYFELIRHNSVEENQVLASQQPDEELLVKLQRRIYRIR